MDIKVDMDVINRGRLFAVGDVTIDSLFVIRQVKVFITEDKKKYNVVFPKQLKGEKKEPFFRLLTEEAKEELSKIIWKAFMDELDRLDKFEREQLEISIVPVKDGRNLRAYANMKYHGIMEVKGIRIMSGKNGLFVSYPSLKTEQGYIELFTAKTSDVRDLTDAVILWKYEEATKIKSKEQDARQNKKADKPVLQTRR